MSNKAVFLASAALLFMIVVSCKTQEKESLRSQISYIYDTTRVISYDTVLIYRVDTVVIDSKFTYDSLGRIENIKIMKVASSATKKEKVTNVSSLANKKSENVAEIKGGSTAHAGKKKSSGSVFVVLALIVLGFVILFFIAHDIKKLL